MTYGCIDSNKYGKMLQALAITWCVLVSVLNCLAEANV